MLNDIITAFKHIARYLKHPLVLVGFVLMLVFSIQTKFLGTGILPKLDQQQGGYIAELILHYGFYLGVLTALLGFGLQFYKTYAESRQHQNVQETLTGMQNNLNAVLSPLLPCGLFYTLKFTCNDKDLYHVFGKHKGYKVYDSNKPQCDIPPLPQGMKDGRVFSPAGYYVDYCDGVVKAVGIFRPKHPKYNLIYSEIKHSFCSLNKEDIIQTNTTGIIPLLQPTTIKVEFFFDGKPKTPNAIPPLLLKSSLRSVTEIVAVDLLDNIVFEDIASKGLEIESQNNVSWSVKNLENSYLRVTLEFFFIEGINNISKENWPVLHNLQLRIGSNTNQILTFSLEQLTSQITQKPLNPIATGQAEFVQILFECTIDEKIYTNQLISTG